MSTVNMNLTVNGVNGVNLTVNGESAGERVRPDSQPKSEGRHDNAEIRDLEMQLAEARKEIQNLQTQLAEAQRGVAFAKDEGRALVFKELKHMIFLHVPVAAAFTSRTLVEGWQATRPTL